MNEKTIDLPEAVSLDNTETGAKIKKGLTVVAVAAASVLLVNAAVKRVAKRKRVELTVVDTPSA